MTLYLSQLAPALISLFSSTADLAAKDSGYVLRLRHGGFSGSSLSQTLVFGWLEKPDATLEDLAQRAASLHVFVSPQALDQRFTFETSEFLRSLLAKVVSQVICANPVAIPLLERFSSVDVFDSSTISLPDCLALFWSGCGERTGKGQAALKIHVQLDLLTGCLKGPFLSDARLSDQASPLLQNTGFEKRALRVGDLGFFSLPRFKALTEAGVYWLSRPKVQTQVFETLGGKPVNLVKWLEEKEVEGEVNCEIYLGKEEQLPARLLAMRVSPAIAEGRRAKLRAEAKSKSEKVSQAKLDLAGWTLLVTNVPEELMNVVEGVVLMRARWQIELLFKRWKGLGKIDEWRSEAPMRILCEVYAKLLGLVIEHWCLLSAWEQTNRSLVKAMKTVRKYVGMIVNGLLGRVSLKEVLEEMREALSHGCKINTRKKKPNTYQQLLDPKLSHQPYIRT